MGLCARGLNEPPAVASSFPVGAVTAFCARLCFELSLDSVVGLFVFVFVCTGGIPSRSSCDSISRSQEEEEEDIAKGTDSTTTAHNTRKDYTQERERDRCTHQSVPIHQYAVRSLIVRPSMLRVFVRMAELQKIRLPFEVECSQRMARGRASYHTGERPVGESLSPPVSCVVTRLAFVFCCCCRCCVVWLGSLCVLLFVCLYSLGGRKTQSETGSKPKRHSTHTTTTVTHTYTNTQKTRRQGGYTHIHTHTNILVPLGPPLFLV